MCGIFGVISSKESPLQYGDTKSVLKTLFELSEMRGKESAGLAVKSYATKKIGVYKDSVPASKLVKTNAYNQFLERHLKPSFEANIPTQFTAIAHARLVTNGSQSDNENNQPVIKQGAVGVHNGILCNIEEMWANHEALNRKFEVDTELLVGLLREKLKNEALVREAVDEVFTEMEGTASTAIVTEDATSTLLATNCGSLYYWVNQQNNVLIFCSEKMLLKDLLEKTGIEQKLGKGQIIWLRAGKGVVVDEASLAIVDFDLETKTGDSTFATGGADFSISDESPKTKPDNSVVNKKDEAYYQSLLERNDEEINALKRCTKCLLPETFPFISFDAAGVCSYCHSHKQLKFEGHDALMKQLEKHRKSNGEPDCIVTLSGGRDSCFVLHTFVEEYGMNPIAYTYDWGMVTDLARRNQSRMCGGLGVEHIVISADITTKRENIRKNVEAWLKRPSLGTIPLFMAGDKQYFYYANLLKKKYNIDLVVMGENMLETTNFKSGFCGIKPNFGTENTFTLSSTDKMKMLWYYGKEYLLNPAYLNSSMRDTMHAFFTYYFMDKDNLNLFDYKVWDETEVNDLLLNHYNWELSPDTTTTWRIGDGTAAFYNYIYYNVAGFSEFDTFRSNQIREGALSREKALELVKQENQPRFESMKWYFDTIGIDMEKAIKRINEIPKFYRNKSKLVKA